MKRGKREVEEHRRIDSGRNIKRGEKSLEDTREGCGTDREGQSVRREQCDGEAS